MAAAQITQLVAGVIEVIHGVTEPSTATRNYLRARLDRAQLWSQARPITEVMSVLTPPKRDINDNLIFELSFTEENWKEWMFRTTMR